jgi:hypothetical protein
MERPLDLDSLQQAKRVRTAEPIIQPPAGNIRGTLIDAFYQQFASGDDEFIGSVIPDFGLDSSQFDDSLDSAPAPPKMDTDAENVIPEMKFNRDSGYEAGRLICLTLRLKTEPVELQLAPFNSPEKGNIRRIIIGRCPF